mmetsp:Transcript_35625/g.41238  ORF Transcript_35625/g.41238 Transcript_35625/m.41238 type:complete len:423 (-) Transcript_35625:218-1486(-)
MATSTTTTMANYELSCNRHHHPNILHRGNRRRDKRHDRGISLRVALVHAFVLALIACLASSFRLIHATTNPQLTSSISSGSSIPSTSSCVTTKTRSPTVSATSLGAHEQHHSLNGKSKASLFSKLNLFRRRNKHDTINNSDKQHNDVKKRHDFSLNESYNLNTGEYGAPLLSRLVYHYSTTLLDKAQKRRLTQNDAYAVPDRYNMNTIVPGFCRAYEDEKRWDHDKKLEKTSKNKGSSDDGVHRQRHISNASDPILLAKALLTHQKKTLLLTGGLRLLNTIIQAIPSILLARLLRRIESNAPVPHSLAAAVQLVAVLLVKMLVENAVSGGTKGGGKTSGEKKILRKERASRSAGVGDGDEEEDGAEDGYAAPLLASSPLGAGGVMNLMQSDASILESAALQLHTLWDGSLQGFNIRIKFRYI